MTHRISVKVLTTGSVARPFVLKSVSGLDHVTDIDDKRNVTTATLIYSLNRIIGVAVVMN